jgi:2-isopropylmalate synthase
MNERTVPREKYQPFPLVDLPGRKWPGRKMEKAPRWCSVDLRDGNQALETPMSVDEKIDLFTLLVERGFTEIEVGFPSASQTEHAFTRALIERDLIPDNVTIQVLTQAREDLIRKTFEAVQGARKVVVHLYNSTSTLQRRVVFGMNREEITDLAVKGARFIREEAARHEGMEVRFEYSPESFTGTELDYAVEICDAVVKAWEPGPGERVILNLPATVEMATPNVYADQIEWFIGNLGQRENALISLHAHNDRGTAVAATELALLAGAERVEGTLFGNGERTGNVDIVTLALNMFSQGIDPGLDFTDLAGVVEVYQRCTRMPVHPRHPYAGELVFTAFSGSHQDAIRKGMKARGEESSAAWEVPYLPIDPNDIGRAYKSIIRINSQSGKGGVAFVLESEYGYALPKKMHPEVGKLVQAVSEKTGREVTPEVVRRTFEGEYLGRISPYDLEDCRISASPGGAGEESRTRVVARIRREGQSLEIEGEGNGPIDAFCNAVRESEKISFTLVSYHEHSLERGSASRAVSYIELEGSGGRTKFGVGIDPSISLASFRAVLGALNHLLAKEKPPSPVSSPPAGERKKQAGRSPDRNPLSPPGERAG